MISLYFSSSFVHFEGLITDSLTKKMNFWQYSLRLIHHLNFLLMFFVIILSLLWRLDFQKTTFNLVQWILWFRGIRKACSSNGIPPHALRKCLISLDIILFVHFYSLYLKIFHSAGNVCWRSTVLIPLTIALNCKVLCFVTSIKQF